MVNLLTFTPEQKKLQQWVPITGRTQLAQDIAWIILDIHVNEKLDNAGDEVQLLHNIQDRVNIVIKQADTQVVQHPSI